MTTTRGDMNKQERNGHQWNSIEKQWNFIETKFNGMSLKRKLWNSSTFQIQEINEIQWNKNQ